MSIGAVFLTMFLAAPATAADSFCHAFPADPEFPAGLTGKYQVVGKTTKGVAYTGSVEVEIRDKTFQVRRSVAGVTTTGSATLQECGMDKIRSIRVVYRHKASSILLTCTIGADGDNYFRLTCRGAGGRLEAWFQDE
jgi:hypothetical protein